MSATSLYISPLSSSQTEKVTTRWNAETITRTPSASPSRLELRTTRDVWTPDPISRVAYSAMNCAISLSSAAVFITRTLTGDKDTDKREQKQVYLHFAEREYLRRSQSTDKRGQCQIYLNIAERKYLRRSQRYIKGRTVPKPNCAGFGKTLYTQGNKFLCIFAV